MPILISAIGAFSMQIHKLISVAMILISSGSQALEIGLETKQGFELKADYYQSNKVSDRAVLMLHQCNYNRSMYSDMAQQLAKRGIHALSLDFRGFGESIDEEFDIGKIQNLADEEQRKAWAAISKHWPDDVQLAYDYLRSKVAGDGIIGVIGASCGGSQAITLAENQSIAAMGFFSSGQRQQNITRYETNLANTPTLIIASEDDGGTYTSAIKLFAAAKNASSKFVSYKGDLHGYPLLDSDPDLGNSIVNWFERQLMK
jgi:dienelactone hydrolase